MEQTTAGGATGRGPGVVNTNTVYGGTRKSAPPQGDQAQPLTEVDTHSGTATVSTPTSSTGAGPGSPRSRSGLVVGPGQAGSRAALGGPPEADGSGCCPVLKDGSPTPLPALAQAGAAVDGQELVVLGWGLSAGGLGESGPRGGRLSSQQVEDAFPVSGWG